MSVIGFQHLKITTMTLVLPLHGNVNLDAAFELLKITRIQLPQPKRQTQKYKIPHCSEPGAILSLRYKGFTRGIIRSTSSKHFKNSITIDVATKVKNVSIKLSSTKIQMCGASSVDQGLEGANYIIQQLLDIQDSIDRIQNNPEVANTTINWLKEAIMGDATHRIVSESTEGSERSETENNAVIPWDAVRISQDHTLKVPTAPYPENVDAQIVSFFLRLLPDFIYYSDFCSEIDWIRTVKSVTTRPLEIQQVHKAMVNYNYDLGFSVNRFELVRRINGLNGFFARYNNSIEHNVTVELPYEVPEQHRNMRRKNKNPCHIFLVYMSGLVTQSGPGEELMRDAYYLFNSTINSIREHIIKPDIPRTLKYKPTWAIPKSELVKQNADFNGITANTVTPLIEGTQSEEHSIRSEE